MTISNFVVIDTEGKDKVNEIAIINSQGDLIYEAFCSENASLFPDYKDLKTIIQDVSKLIQAKTVIFHYAEHDLEVLKRSFQAVNVCWPKFTVMCSFEMAKKHFPNLPSHSLAYLSKHFRFKVNNRYFDEVRAHTAHYDASFTHQLYKVLERHINMLETLKNTPNPFGSSRVDNPFQQHLDLGEVYRSEFEVLTSALKDVKNDANHQSKGTVVIGEAGAGKTHLMMRLAKERLKTNRLLFIRQPNNPSAILYHTYARILESFAERVPSTGHTQLEEFLANSFIAILRSIPEVTEALRGKETIAALEEYGTKLYSRARTENTTKFRETWEYISRYISRWWVNNYTTAGHSVDILRGIVKFCRYTDPHKKEAVMRWLAANELSDKVINSIGLNNWQEDMSREEFALEAMAIFGRLSVSDEPLIIIFDQLEGLSARPELLENFGSAIKEMLTYVPNSLIIFNLFPDRWIQFKQTFDDSVVGRMSQYEVHLALPEKDQLKEILQLKAQGTDLELESIFTPNELFDIFEQRSIRSVLNRASAYYRAKANNLPLPEPKTTIITPSITPTGNFESRMQRLENEFDLLKQALGGFFQASQIPQTFTDSTQKPPVEPVESVASVADDVKTAKTEILDYLEQKRSALERVYGNPTIIADSDELGKLITIAEVCQSFKSLKLEQLRLGKSKLPEHLVVKAKKDYTIGFLNTGGAAFTSRLKNFNQLLVRHPNTHFYLVRDSRQSPITGKVGKEEIEKLNYANNGTFILLSKTQKLNFELVYNLIVDVQNRDVEIDVETALEILLSQEKDDWLSFLL